MARGVNKVIIVGNLGADPDTKSMPSGNMVANFSVATSESWNDRDTGERQEKTEWHRVVFFGRLAEIADQYLRKGSQVYVEGKLQTRKWEDRDGNERWTTEIVGNQLEMLGDRMSSGSSQSNNMDQSTTKTNSNFSDEEFDEYLEYAIECRRRVKEQMNKRKPDDEFKNIQLSYFNHSNQEKIVYCPESKDAEATQNPQRTHLNNNDLNIPSSNNN